MTFAFLYGFCTGSAVWVSGERDRDWRNPGDGGLAVTVHKHIVPFELLHTLQQLLTAAVTIQHFSPGCKRFLYEVSSFEFEI